MSPAPQGREAVVGAARPGELLPPLSCAVSLEGGQWGPGFEKREAEEGEIIRQIPQAAGQAGMVSGQVILSGWAACESSGGARGPGRPRLRPAVSLSVGLCWRQFGVPPVPPSPVPRLPRALVAVAGPRGYGGTVPAACASPASGLGPGPSLGLLPVLRLIRWGKILSPGCLALLTGRPQASGLSQAALLEVWWLFVAVPSVRGEEDG